MPDAEPINYRLNDLKLRWQRDPSSRLFLQLANEHRKAGQIEEAVAVLEQGLEHRPNDLSALVVLGRSRLELERAEEAVEPLETVVSRDPTHIVASKLLIEAHLQRGDAEKAAERLKQYRMLNDRDPELDHLQYRLDRLAEDEHEASTVAGGELEGSSPDDSASQPPDDAAAPEPSEPEPAATPESLAPEPPEVEAPGPAESVAAEPATAGADLFALTDEGPAPDLEALWRTLPTQRPEIAEPFVGLSSLDAASHWDLMSREGIFTSPGAPAEAEAPPESDLPSASVETPAEPEPELAIKARPMVEAESVVKAEPVVRAEPVIDHAPAVETDPVIEPAAEAEPAVELEPAAEAEPAVEPEPAAEAEPAVELEPTAEAEPAVEAEAAPGAPEPRAEVAAEPLETTGGEPDEEPATVTLGELYMRQGHLDEAKRIFEQVLKQDPDNLTALDNLARLGVSRPVAQRTQPLSAADLLAVRTASAKIPEGLTAKKVLVLSNYLKHLRASASQDHVS